MTALTCVLLYNTQVFMSIPFDSNHIDARLQSYVDSNRHVHHYRANKTTNPPVNNTIKANDNLLSLARGAQRNPQKIDENIPESSSNNHQRFSHLIAIMPAGVLVIDQYGRVTLANEQAISLLEEPLVGQLWRHVIARVFAPQDDDGHEVSMTNGRKVKIDISPLTEEKGQLIVINDLTQTRELQSRVGHMQRLSSLGKMVASLAHQVRTPLSSAILYAENLKSMRLQNNMAVRFCDKLSLRLKELESQVNDMLLFAKSSDNQIVSVLSPVDILQQCVAQTEAQLEQANIALAMQSNIQSNTQSNAAQVIRQNHKAVDTAASSKNTEANIYANQLKHCVVLGNSTAIAGAITNLITNAMQALEGERLANEYAQKQTNNKTSGCPRIELSLAEVDLNSQAFCVFTVSDNGKGLAQEDINRLFEPFYTTKSQGTGLGLAVVSTVAKSHKGFVKCGNNTSGGAFFSLYLPVHNPKTHNPPINLSASANAQHNEQNLSNNTSDLTSKNNIFNGNAL